MTLDETFFSVKTFILVFIGRLPISTLNICFYREIQQYPSYLPRASLRSRATVYDVYLVSSQYLKPKMCALTNMHGMPYRILFGKNV